MNVKKQMKINQETLRFIRHCIVSQKEKRKKHSCVSSLTLLATTNYMANIKLKGSSMRRKFVPSKKIFVSQGCKELGQKKSYCKYKRFLNNLTVIKGGARSFKMI